MSLALASATSKTVVRRAVAANAVSLRSTKHVSVGAVRCMGGGGATPPLPPFARNLAPQEKLHESHELMWDDGVAPELTIDFDVPHYSGEKGLAMWLGGIAFFVTLYQVVKLTDPASKNPAAPRELDVCPEVVSIVGKPIEGCFPAIPSPAPPRK
uniref:Uncharacterized protein n=1 Tax=Corethron hystrix TaxID=216773 RepID=A0A7S1FZR7_9STRA|mmetsp:Transcript_43238/g.101369  ORF Transcript_43238/g.101369 Transcript_43238/m.101369 type:complete len:155 (+) Transcript_43238:112-576(+)|eukprot:CAMPEP_0113307728 /NCGR_PEP_ID=MMETSP0010_2-20120614/6461_1 /TAXON_ID=216773 ORGANISM="Corethron hystrix, Strain 308" /NCGR_SAMPLE_ID=MMETSP0010_2 /ASSEMBLY_ACC=CAM_ASM_000155 /LENGTH=154 /DNA_ID=CAMNT_0000162649 /DNA_START=28 /DNA_END=492 /DNA_ORIENTATION=+ /assembly_acc=CAM_ASM_000155